MIGQKQAVETGRAALEEYGIRNVNAVHWNHGTPTLIEHAVERREGHLAADGAFVVRTGQFTGRSPKDKFMVRDEITDQTVQWGPVNQPITEAQFDRLFAKHEDFWQGRDVYVQDCRVGADPAYSCPIRVITQYAWHALFARQLFIRPEPAELQDYRRSSPSCSRPSSRPIRLRTEPIRKPASSSTSRSASY